MECKDIENILFKEKYLDSIIILNDLLMTRREAIRLLEGRLSQEPINFLETDFGVLKDYFNWLLELEYDK